MFFLIRIAFLAVLAVMVAEPILAQRPIYSGGGWSRYERYGGGYGRYRNIPMRPAGLKFDMDLVDKKDQEIVEKGIVTIDDHEIGPVSRFNEWFNGPYPIRPGYHVLRIELKDGREFNTRILLNPSRVTVVYPRFSDLSDPQSTSRQPPSGRLRLQDWKDADDADPPDAPPTRTAPPQQ